MTEPVLPDGGQVFVCATAWQDATRWALEQGIPLQRLRRIDVRDHSYIRLRGCQKPELLVLFVGPRLSAVQVDTIFAAQQAVPMVRIRHVREAA